MWEFDWKSEAVTKSLEGELEAVIVLNLGIDPMEKIEFLELELPLLLFLCIICACLYKFCCCCCCCSVRLWPGSRNISRDDTGPGNTQTRPKICRAKVFGQLGPMGILPFFFFFLIWSKSIPTYTSSLYCACASSEIPFGIKHHTCDLNGFYFEWTFFQCAIHLWLQMSVFKMLDQRAF